MKIVFEQTHLPNWLKKRAFLTPDRVAIEYKSERVTFSQLDEKVMETAGKLYGIGVRKGSRAAVLLKNDLQTVFALHALLYLGAEIVLLNNRLSSSELSWQLEDSGSEWLFSTKEWAEKLDEMGFSRTEVVFVENLKNCMPYLECPVQSQFSMQETATIMYTSGTTGNPKGVQQTYGNHWWSAVGSVLNLGLKEEDCWLCTVPLFHISGLSILFRSVIYGIKVILHERFSEEEVNRCIMEEGVTIVSVVSSMLNRMLENLGNNRYPDSFRCMLLGGGPAPLPMLERCRDLDIPIYQTYGMTETSSQIATLSPEYSLTKLGSAGKALFPCEIKIMTDNGEAPANVSGEIFVRGQNVTKGYLNREEANLQSFSDGWFKTGDIGFLDEEGFLFVLDRRSDLIISGGENIYPAEIESVLMKHPAVFEAGVTGIPDEKWGHVPIAFIVLNEHAMCDEDEIKMHCKKLLASYKVPKMIHFVKELPRNASNKLLRRELLKLLERKEKDETK
jgi:o-succinylbenzoate---CoA ligase